MHNNVSNWLYNHLEGITGGTTAAIYGFVTYTEGLNEILFRVAVALICGFVGAAGAWIFRKMFDKK
mgnify:FL=1